MVGVPNRHRHGRPESMQHAGSRSRIPWTRNHALNKSRPLSPTSTGFSEVAPAIESIPGLRLTLCSEDVWFS